MCEPNEDPPNLYQKNLNNKREYIAAFNPTTAGTTTDSTLAAASLVFGINGINGCGVNGSGGSISSSISSNSSGSSNSFQSDDFNTKDQPSSPKSRRISPTVNNDVGIEQQQQSQTNHILYNSNCNSSNFNDMNGKILNNNNKNGVYINSNSNYYDNNINGYSGINNSNGSNSNNNSVSQITTSINNTNINSSNSSEIDDKLNNNNNSKNNFNNIVNSNIGTTTSFIPHHIVSSQISTNTSNCMYQQPQQQQPQSQQIYQQHHQQIQQQLQQQQLQQHLQQQSRQLQQQQQQIQQQQQQIQALSSMLPSLPDIESISLHPVIINYLYISASQIHKNLGVLCDFMEQSSDSTRTLLKSSYLKSALEIIDKLSGTLGSCLIANNLVKNNSNGGNDNNSNSNSNENNNNSHNFVNAQQRLPIYPPNNRIETLPSYLQNQLQHQQMQQQQLTQHLQYKLNQLQQPPPPPSHQQVQQYQQQQQQQQVHLQPPHSPQPASNSPQKQSSSPSQPQQYQQEIQSPQQQEQQLYQHEVQQIPTPSNLQSPSPRQPSTSPSHYQPQQMATTSQPQQTSTQSIPTPQIQIQQTISTTQQHTNNNAPEEPVKLFYQQQNHISQLHQTLQQIQHVQQQQAVQIQKHQQMQAQLQHHQTVQQLQPKKKKTSNNSQSMLWALCSEIRNAYVDFKQSQLSDFKLLNLLGCGSFAKVRLCQHIPTKRLFCMKILNQNKIIRLRQEAHVCSEKEVLLAIDHRFIVKLFATYKDRKSLYFLQEYIPGGELFDHIRSCRSLSPKVTRIYAAEIILALEYLHSEGIIYRDLKPENLLIDLDGHIKLTDFGFAKRIIDDTKSMCGTPEYIAPEILSGHGHGKSVDWWSLGILIYEMLVGVPPFIGDQHNHIFKLVRECDIAKKIPPGFDPLAKDLIEKLVVVDIDRRLGCGSNGSAEIKSHPFFESIDWKTLEYTTDKGPLTPKLREVSLDGEDNSNSFEEEEDDDDDEIIDASDILRKRKTEFFERF